MPSTKLTTGAYLFGPNADADHGFDERRTQNRERAHVTGRCLDVTGHDMVDPRAALEEVAGLSMDAAWWREELDVMGKGDALYQDMEAARKVWGEWETWLEGASMPKPLSKEERRRGMSDAPPKLSGSIAHALGEDYRLYKTLESHCRVRLGRGGRDERLGAERTRLAGPSKVVARPSVMAVNATAAPAERVLHPAVARIDSIGIAYPPNLDRFRSSAWNAAHAPVEPSAPPASMLYPLTPTAPSRSMSTAHSSMASMQSRYFSAQDETSTRRPGADPAGATSDRGSPRS
ncbi:hypothetical protein CDN99_07615 [Roseateles aquatilis]|uniref:Uncharacterized protein n=1 Tax=Roseateles aquatilis TaxID=431061 RepID=A0A246JIW8_9BURK|nr:hypothetical protein [Roseateles aquatilis]OWQ92199.1 hypothetical protein CDN99_07615 [Roseateles aquatilis]